MTDAFYAKVHAKAIRRNLKWYNDNLMRTLEQAKEKQARDIDKSIALAKQLQEVLGRQVEHSRAVAPRELARRQDADLMKPVEPEVTAVLMRSGVTGATEKYLRLRNRKAPEDKFYFRAVSSWDYGWQQSAGRAGPPDARFPRRNIIQETLYRSNNSGPDPGHYRPPAAADPSFCSQDACYI